ncbi:MAG: hypothetical protein GX559_02135 [Candidatus Pacebacteria bacterium]|nr:hypothetical protein [Candidatus Paceibacterota bacterium]
MKISCPKKTIFLVSVFVIFLLVFFRKNPNFFAFSDSTKGNFYLNHQMVRANEDESDPSPVTVELDPAPSLIHNLTPSFSGTATTTNDSYIVSVMYRIDENPPKYCWAKDEDFDSDSEDFICQIDRPLANGEHTIFIKAWDEDESESDPELSKITFTIKNPNPPVADFPQVAGEVYATAVSDDGKTLYIGGDFESVEDPEGTPKERHNLAAIDLETMLVTDWNPSDWYWSGPVYDIEIDGGYVLIGGSFYYSVDENNVSQFAKLHQETGLIDEACTPRVLRTGDFQTYTIYDLKLTNDYIYLGGDFDDIDDTRVYGLARLNRDTCALDTTWLPEVGGSVQTIETMGDSVFIGGDFWEVNESEREGFAKISASTGILDSNCIKEFDDNNTIYSIKADNNYLYVGGEFDQIYDPPLNATFQRNGLIRLKNDNSCLLDQIWDPNPHFYDFEDDDWYPGAIYSINLDETDSSIYVGGSFSSIGGQSGSEFAKLDIDTGLADLNWNPGIWVKDGGGGSNPVPSTVHSSVITDNYLIVGGGFDRVGTEERHSLAAFPHEKALGPTPEPSTSSADKAKKDHQDKTETVQIPHAVKKLFGLIVAKPVKDSNTNGQEVLSIVFKDTLDFDAYLSVNHTPVGDLPMLREQNNQASANNTAANKGNFLIAGWRGHQLMGFKENKTIYWQIGNIQQMFYKAYPVAGKEAPVIIPEIQHKSSIIALKYNKSQLIPPGEPNTKFSELKLKLAHSMDGVNWRVMPNSVVDPINNTVAVIDKLGGYYVIVASY